MRQLLSLKKTWTEVKESLEHIQIFGIRVSIHILFEKCSKSDVYNTWNRIFIGYSNIAKYFETWALKTYQVFIASKLVVNKSK